MGVYEKMDRVTVVEAAARLGVKEQAIRKRIQRGTIAHDKDDDGRITSTELYEPRRKAFAKLDSNGNGTLSFEEWAVRTATKFGEADTNRDSALDRRAVVDLTFAVPRAIG